MFVAVVPVNLTVEVSAVKVPAGTNGVPEPDNSQTFPAEPAFKVWFEEIFKISETVVVAVVVA